MGENNSSVYEYQFASCQTAVRRRTMHRVRASQSSHQGRLSASVTAMNSLRRCLRFGAHSDDLSKAVHHGLQAKVGRGLNIREDFPLDFEHQIVLACARIPKGVVCLESALAWHGMHGPDSSRILIAVDRKAKKPVGNKRTDFAIRVPPLPVRSIMSCAVSAL